MSVILPRLRMAALVIIAAGVMGLAVTSSALAGDPSPTIRVSPSFQNVAVNGEVQVDIMVEDAPLFAAYEFHMLFDPSLLEFESITHGGEILEDAGRSALCLGPDVADMKNAIISYACASTGGAGGPSGTGLLATVSFTALCPGQAELTFVPTGKDLSVDPVSISSLLGDGIETNGVGGDVNINGVSCSNPGTMLGDANCNGDVDAVDAALILQINAGLLDELSCESNADVNQNGAIDSIDAALILQFTAGLLKSF